MVDDDCLVVEFEVVVAVAVAVFIAFASSSVSVTEEAVACCSIEGTIDCSTLRSGSAIGS